MSEAFERTGKLFVLSAPSGGGKSTVIEALRKESLEIGYSISATTRKPRAGEKHGEAYYFLSEEAFLQKIEEDAFVEWAIVHGYYYGTLWSQILQPLNEGQSILLDIDVQGGIQLKDKRPESILIFLLPTSMEVLEKRLRDRKTDDEATIQRRLNNAREELQEADRYDYQVINDQLEKTIMEVKSIILKHSKC